jgi:2-polyprenyl-6-methoxyphenol hydroxylase-like FAD-dependent oxidoreductase
VYFQITILLGLDILSINVLTTMNNQTPELKVLVVGSGIAGPCFAFWLHKFLPSSDITILERAPEPRLGGQAVDLRSAAVPIVDRMGLLQAVKEKTTTEAGIEFIYADGRTKATFPVSGDAEQQGSWSIAPQRQSLMF